MRVIITGGAGFIGSRLALAYKSHDASADVVAFDNLRRRGSETNLDRLERWGIQFVHGDIRNASDFSSVGNKPFDLFIEASAEPSVLAGLDGNVDYLVGTNLIGTINCLEFARRMTKALIFLSTSRVYAIEPLRRLPLVETKTRLTLGEKVPDGIRHSGVSESFPTHLPRSLYGATKLASEIMVQEYSEQFGFPAIINRCSVICGAGQFGKVEQGVFSLWMMNHMQGKPLQYKGFGGKGKQVRDLLSPLDLFDLILKQVESPKGAWGKAFNVGGGLERSTSLLELTEICRELSGRHVPVSAIDETSAVDIPYFVTDSSLAHSTFSWHPKRTVREIMTEIRDSLLETDSRNLVKRQVA